MKKIKLKQPTRKVDKTGKPWFRSQNLTNPTA
jgi:hypothetical protein